MRFQATPAVHLVWVLGAALAGLVGYRMGVVAAAGSAPRAPATEPAPAPPIAATGFAPPRPVVAPICTPIAGREGPGDCSRFESHCVDDAHCEVKRAGGVELGVLTNAERRMLSLGVNGGTVVHDLCVDRDCSTYVEVCGHHSEEARRCERDLRVHYVEPILPARHAGPRRGATPRTDDLAHTLETPTAPAPERYRHHRIAHPTEPSAHSYRSHHYPTYSHASHSSGPVHVRGYYRRNGTYVRPHTRRR